MTPATVATTMQCTTRVVETQRVHLSTSDLCTPCRSVLWEPVFSGDYGNAGRQPSSLEIMRGSLKDLISRQPCAICRLILHLMLPEDAVTYIGRYRAAGSSVMLPTIDWVLKLNAFTPKLTIYKTLPNGECARLGSIQVAKDYDPHDGTGTRPPVDLDFVGRCIDVCRNHHQQCKELSGKLSLAQVDGMRLIDVVEQRIVKAKQTDKFFALSYIWGGTNMLRLTRANLAQLEQPGSLTKLQAQIANIINTAMALVAQLGWRYLFVDALCILQDDYHEKYIQIQQMDAIYRKASLTIISLSAKDANGSLPGIDNSSRSHPLRYEKVRDVWMLAQPDSTLSGRISQSRYNARAWTFQERLMSRRCLLVDDKQIFYYCHGTARAESAPSFPIAPDKLAVSVGGLQMSGGAGGNRYNDRAICSIYIHLAEDYMRRKLTFASDILNAFAGMMTVLEQAGCGPFLNGLPEHFFDVALLWNTAPGAKPRRTAMAPNMGSCGHVQFPSWSWIKCDGRLSWACRSWLGLHNESYKLYGSNIIRSEIASFRLESTRPTTTSTIATGKSSTKRPVRRLRDSFVTFSLLMPESEAIHTSTEQQQYQTSLLLQQVALCFEAWSVSAVHFAFHASESSQTKYLSVAGYSPSSSFCGTMNLDFDDGMARFDANSSRCWLLALSSHSHGYTSILSKKELWLTEYARLKSSVINVMLVIQQGEFTERIGLGMVFGLAWWTEVQPVKQAVKLR